MNKSALTPSGAIPVASKVLTLANRQREDGVRIARGDPANKRLGVAMAEERAVIEAENSRIASEIATLTAANRNLAAVNHAAEAQFPVRDRDCAALQYVAKGQLRTSPTGLYAWVRAGAGIGAGKSAVTSRNEAAALPALGRR